MLIHRLDHVSPAFIRILQSLHAAHTVENSLAISGIHYNQTCYNHGSQTLIQGTMGYCSKLSEALSGLLNIQGKYTYICCIPYELLL